jgi:hypothetical protein
MGGAGLFAAKSRQPQAVDCSYSVHLRNNLSNDLFGRLRD